MAVFGGCIGALLGFVILIVIAEWFFVNWFGRHDLLEGLLVAILVAGGAFVGSRLSPASSVDVGSEPRRSATL